MLLSNTEAKLLHDKVFPLGRVPKYNVVNGSIDLVETTTRRFIHDGWHVKRTPKSKVLIDANKLDVNYLGFGITEAITVILQDDYDLYLKLFNFFEKIEKYVSTIISECSQSIIVISHNSFGERLFPHIHQDSGLNLPSLSLFFKLTNNTNNSPTLCLYDEVGPDTKFFKKGYTDHKLLLLYEHKNQYPEKISISNNVAVLFNAYNTPHTFSYTDDIWLTVIYDHVLPINPAIKKGGYDVFPVQL